MLLLSGGTFGNGDGMQFSFVVAYRELSSIEPKLAFESLWYKLRNGNIGRSGVA